MGRDKEGEGRTVAVVACSYWSDSDGRLQLVEVLAVELERLTLIVSTWLGCAKSPNSVRHPQAGSAKSDERTTCCGTTLVYLSQAVSPASDRSTQPRMVS